MFQVTTIYNFFSKLANVMGAITILLCVSIFLSSIQNIFNRWLFYDDSILSWPIVKKRKQFRYLKAPVFDSIYGGTGFLVLNILRVLLVLSFIIFRSQSWIVYLLTMVNYIVYFRSALLCNASDQVNSVVLTALSLGNLFRPFNSLNLVVLFLGCVLLLSYFTSGLLKIFEPGWRNGSYLKKIFVSRSFGRGWVYKMIGIPSQGFYKVSSLTIVIWQLTSILAPVMPPVLLVFFIFIGVMFHVATGFLMGLSNFIWSFIALVPAEIFLNHSIISNF